MATFLVQLLLGAKYIPTLSLHIKDLAYNIDTYWRFDIFIKTSLEKVKNDQLLRLVTIFDLLQFWREV